MPVGVYKHRKGFFLSAEWKHKISLAHKGKKLSEDHKKKLSLAHKGKKHTDNWKQRMSDLKKGKQPKGGFKKGQIAWNKNGFLKNCLICNELFYTTLKNKQKTCSKKCGYMSSSVAIGLALRGRKLSKENRLIILKNIRKAITHNGVGANHPKWRGGVSKNKHNIADKEYSAWRKSVFERDNYTCQNCGLRGGCGKKVILNADHIKSWSSYPELRFNIENGRTLCLDCHKKTENYGGKALRRPILQFNITKVLIKRWVSSFDAAKALGLSAGGISNCLHRRSKSSGGFIWRFEKD